MLTAFVLGSSAAFAQAMPPIKAALYPTHPRVQGQTSFGTTFESTANVVVEFAGNPDIIMSANPNSVLRNTINSGDWLSGQAIDPESLPMQMMCSASLDDAGTATVGVWYDTSPARAVDIAANQSFAQTTCNQMATENLPNFQMA